MSTVSDGGHAIARAVSLVHGPDHHQRDIWHLLHVAAQVQGRLDRAVKLEQDRLPALYRKAERTAAGKRAQGRPSAITHPQQQAQIARMEYVAESVGYLCHQLHRLLEVVVLQESCILTCEQRQGEIEAVLDLLDEVTPIATPALQGHIQMLSKQLRLALSQTLLFARELEGRQSHTERVLESEAVALLA